LKVQDHADIQVMLHEQTTNSNQNITRYAEFIRTPYFQCADQCWINL